MTKLIVIDIPETDPQINLDVEESLMGMLGDDQLILRFWINSPSLIMGRFQRQEFEVDQYATEQGIPVLRRFTGGGTVYHDLGNLNVTIVANKSLLKNDKHESGSTICTRLVCNALNELGLKLNHDEKRNALFHGELKVLGSAASISKDTYLFHCSILVDSDLEELNRTILKNPNYSSAKGALVKSVRSTVTNLVSIRPDLTMKMVKENLVKVVVDRFELSYDRRIETAQELNDYGA